MKTNMPRTYCDEVCIGITVISCLFFVGAVVTSSLCIVNYMNNGKELEHTCTIAEYIFINSDIFLKLCYDDECAAVRIQPPYASGWVLNVNCSLTDTYPINGTVLCYTYANHPSDIRMSSDIDVFLIVSPILFFFFLIGIVVVVIMTCDQVCCTRGDNAKLLRST